jgi:hypothetical protein
VTDTVECANCWMRFPERQLLRFPALDGAFCPRCYHKDSTMPCYTIRNQNGSAILCGNLGPPCFKCGDVGGFLCDFPVAAGKTCDRSMCGSCAHAVAPDTHYCDAHHGEWKAFRDAGGVAAELANVVPYKRTPGGGATP